MSAPTLLPCALCGRLPVTYKPEPVKVHGYGKPIHTFALKHPLPNGCTERDGVAICYEEGDLQPGEAEVQALNAWNEAQGRAAVDCVFRDFTLPRGDDVEEC